MYISLKSEYNPEREREGKTHQMIKMVLLLRLLNAIKNLLYSLHNSIQFIWKVIDIVVVVVIKSNLFAYLSNCM